MTDIVKPNLKNFIKSLRDVGYNFHIALADIIDNSIAAGAKNVLIETENVPKLRLCVLDDGVGMNEDELIEAMRLGSKDPDDERSKDDLGRFGLGLKTASFSQCKRLTVITKRNNIINIKAWDLDTIEEKNEWYLLTPSFNEIESTPLYQKLQTLDSGTLVIWDKIDGINDKDYYEELDILHEHLSLVFHRFLEGSIKGKKFNLLINNNSLPSLNPFNEQNHATQVLPEQIIKIDKQKIVVTPYILPHHSKLSQQEYDKYATKEGYTKTQGFYLYRSGRLLIHGTWWGLNKVSDAHRLVRVKVDITNDQDRFWNIDVKKSVANPNQLIKKELKKILSQVLSRGKNTYTKRGAILKDKTVVPFWEVIHEDKSIRFIINQNHPILSQIQLSLDEKYQQIFDTYIKGLEAYIPLGAIQAHMISEPHKINQNQSISDVDREVMFQNLLGLDLTEEEIEELKKTEIFKRIKELH
jgi:hypothetical protein